MDNTHNLVKCAAYGRGIAFVAPIESSNNTIVVAQITLNFQINTDSLTFKPCDCDSHNNIPPMAYLAMNCNGTAYVTD